MTQETLDVLSWNVTGIMTTGLSARRWAQAEFSKPYSGLPMLLLLLLLLLLLP